MLGVLQQFAGGGGRYDHLPPPTRLALPGSPLPPAAAATAGHEVLTLTGWVALVGMFALATVVLALVVYVVRRYTSKGPSGRGQYTMVVKHETELAHQQQHAGTSPRSLPRRYG